MTETLIELALREYIGTAGLAWPIAWPNEDLPAPSPVPRLQVAIDRNGRNDPTLTGGAVPASIGFVRILVIVEKGKSSKTANGKADQVAALFNKGRRIPVAGGSIIATNAADIRAGFRDGPEWIIPVISPYRAEPE